MSLLNTSLAVLATSQFGFDVSTTISSSAASCFASSGQGFAVPRGYCSSGSVDTQVCKSIIDAASVGIEADAYMFPCPTCSKSANTQLGELVSYLNDNCKNEWSGRIWLDVEGKEYWMSQSDNKAFYQELVDSCEVYGIRCGVYASQYQWSDIFGSTSYSYGNNLPLWYPHYDGKASFDDFVPFGGWTSPHAKQYDGNVALCDMNIDKNYSPNWSDADGCRNAGNYCGNDGLNLDSNHLYRCEAAGAEVSSDTACDFTCVTMPSGQNDVCSTSGSCSTVDTGYYCGTDKIGGDSDTLYRCESSKPNGASYCSKGCVTAPSGQNDYCAS